MQPHDHTSGCITAPAAVRHDLCHWCVQHRRTTGILLAKTHWSPRRKQKSGASRPSRYSRDTVESDRQITCQNSLVTAVHKEYQDSSCAQHRSHTIGVSVLTQFKLRDRGLEGVSWRSHADWPTPTSVPPPTASVRRAAPCTSLLDPPRARFSLAFLVNAPRKWVLPRTLRVWARIPSKKLIQACWRR